MGYVIIWVQVDGVQGYGPRFVRLCSTGPCDLGNSNDKSCHEHDKRKGDRCPGYTLGNAWVAYLLAVWWATATVEDDKVVAGGSDPTNYNEVVITKDTKTKDAFLPHIICMKTRTDHTGVGLNVMTQALCAKDGSLP